MEYRKLISFGKSSFVVSLPKSWVTQNKLRKGDHIYFDEKESTLILGAQEHESTEDKSSVIFTDGKSLLQLRRELNAAYIENNREIIFKGKDLKEKSEEILKFVRDLIALEVLELDSTKIVTRDFLDMEKVSITQLVKKMDIIVRSMLKDCTESFTEKNAENLLLRDRDVNRLSFLLYRIIRYGMRNQSKMFKNYTLTAVDLLNYYWMTFHLEAIADEAKRISRAMQKLSISKAKQQEFVALIKQAESFYLDMIKAYYDTNKERAFELSNRKAPLVSAVNKFYDGIKDTRDVSYMADRFRKLVSSIHELDRLIYQN